MAGKRPGTIHLRIAVGALENHLLALTHAQDTITKNALRTPVRSKCKILTTVPHLQPIIIALTEKLRTLYSLE